MKTRNGFVSNSSSSSFIALVTEEAFKEALSRLEDERQGKILKVIAEKKTIFGKKMRVLKEYTDAGGGSSLWGYDGDERGDILEKAGVEDPDSLECTCKEGEDGKCPACQYQNGEEEWYPEDCVYAFSEVIAKMAKKAEWKEQIFFTDVGDGG